MNIPQKIVFRQKIVHALRSFLYEKNYGEADVPLLVPSLIPESYLDVFETKIEGPQVNAKKAFLTASPEAFLKRLLVEGSGNVFYLGKAFRNGEPFGPLHNHEFTILEWYSVGIEYKQLMKEIEEMVHSVFVQNRNICSLPKGFDLTPPWEYITVDEALQRFAPKNENPNSGAEFEKMYVEFIEPNLGTRGKPTFITDFPTWQSPLAKPKKNNLAERFELYINGVELINGWTELTDYKRQAINCTEEQDERKKRGKPFVPTDLGFLNALKKGMPECAGAAMGVDRLLMVLGGFDSLADVILFPDVRLFTLDKP